MPCRELRFVLSVVFYVVNENLQNRIRSKSCKKQKKTPETVGFQVLFWICRADSNCRPHPYQKVRVHLTLCPLVSLHTVRSLCHKDFCVVFSLAVLPYFRPFVGRFVGNPFSHSSPKPHPLRRSITIPPNTSSKYTYFCQMIYLSLSFKIIKHCPDRQGIFCKLFDTELIRLIVYKAKTIFRGKKCRLCLLQMVYESKFSNQLHFD